MTVATVMREMSARYYDPSTGRFLSEDPIGFDSGDSNQYRYVSNNPVRYNDPSGKIIPALIGAAAWLYFTSESLTDDDSNGPAVYDGPIKDEPRLCTL